MKYSWMIGEAPRVLLPTAGIRVPGSRRPAGAGFTLIELLAVVAAIALLLAITLPAVQRGREAARRMECVDHMRQIGLALHHYEGIHSCFPPIDQETYDRRSGFDEVLFLSRYSPLARTLGQMELTAAYNSINFQLETIDGFGLQANYTIMTLSIGGFLCPSDSMPGVEGYGRNNYRFCTGPTTHLTPVAPEPESNCGVFATWYRCFRPADITDGLSNTVGVSERLQGDWTKTVFKPGGDYLLADRGINYLTADQMVALCSSLPPPPQTSHESKGGESWLISGYHFTDYNHCATPNKNQSSCGINVYTSDLRGRYFQPGSFPATSAHPGGVNVLMMDGGVRFVRDGVNIVHWRALSTHAGGEVVSAGDY